jgi:hypothetical protein
MDVIGNEVKLMSFYPDQQSTTVGMDLEGMNPGIYFYSIYTDNSILASGKLIRQ